MNSSFSASFLPPFCLLSDFFLPPFCLLSASFLPPFCLLSDFFLPPFCLLSASFLPPFWLLSASFLPPFCLLSASFLTSFCLLSASFLTPFWLLSDFFVTCLRRHTMSYDGVSFPEQYKLKIVSIIFLLNFLHLLIFDLSSLKVNHLQISGIPIIFGEYPLFSHKTSMTHVWRCRGFGTLHFSEEGMTFGESKTKKTGNTITFGTRRPQIHQWHSV